MHGHGQILQRDGPDPGKERKVTRPVRLVAVERQLWQPAQETVGTAAHQMWREWSAGATYCKSMGDGMWLFGMPDAETCFAMHREASPNKFGTARRISSPAHRACRNGVRRDHPDIVPAFVKGLAAALPDGKRSDVICMKDTGILKLHANNNEHERFGAFKERVRRVVVCSKIRYFSFVHIAVMMPKFGVQARRQQGRIGRGAPTTPLGQNLQAAKRLDHGAMFETRRGAYVARLVADQARITGLPHGGALLWAIYRAATVSAGFALDVMYSSMQ